MTDELGEVLCSAIAETHAGKAEFEMGVEESDGDSGMSFRSDEGAEDVGEVAAVMGTVLVLGAVVGEGSSANGSALVEALVEIQASEEEEDSGDGEDEAEESDDDADDEGTASLPVRTQSVVTPPQRGRLTAPCLKPGLRSTAEGKRYRVDVSIGVQKKVIEHFDATETESCKGFRAFRTWVATTFPKENVRVFKRSQIHKWKKSIAAHDQGHTVRDNKRCRIVTKPAKGPTSKLKTLLLAYFKGIRSVNGFVSIATLLHHAQLLLKTDDDVKKDVKAYDDTHDARQKIVLCPRFIAKFMKQNRLVLKQVKRRTTLTVPEVMLRAQTFHTHVHRCVRSGFVRFILNFDEMPGSVSGKMSGRVRVVTEIADKDVRLNISADDFKRCCTLIPCVGVMFKTDPGGAVTSHAFQLPTYVLFKGAPVMKAVLNETFDGRTKRGWTKKAVMTGKFMTDAYVPFLVSALQKLDLEGAKTGMLMLDSCRAHITPSVLQTLSCRNFPPLVFILPFSQGGPRRGCSGWTRTSRTCCERAFSPGT